MNEEQLREKVRRRKEFIFFLLTNNNINNPNAEADFKALNLDIEAVEIIKPIEIISMPVSQGEYICEICGKTHKTQNALNGHKKGHK